MHILHNLRVKRTNLSEISEVAIAAVAEVALHCVSARVTPDRRELGTVDGWWNRG
jgi:hypothetical protein